ncbi:MAG TPA: DUF2384 domain-containing protein [Rhabdaerophilum sp.]|nr:DUF2384 domain-containing protein [Rhabdaerophilum sp.]
MREWLDRLSGRRFAIFAPPEPEGAAAVVRFHLDRLSPALRAGADALRDEAIGDFGSPEAADAWLVAHVPFIGGRPVDALRSARGQASVSLTLNNMRYGIYS